MSGNSNPLSSTLSLLIWCCVLVFSIFWLIYPYTSISGEDKLKLQDIFLNVESTPFKKTFYDRYSSYMENGSVSKDEFDKLQSFYADYQVAVASNTAGKFIKEQDVLYKQQQENKKQFDLFWNNYGFYITAFFMFLIIVMVKFLVFNWVKGY